MNAREMFAVLVKGMGFWFWIGAVEAAACFAFPFILAQFARNRPTPWVVPMATGFGIAFLWKALLGCALFFGAHRIASLFYRRHLNEADATG